MVNIRAPRKLPGLTLGVMERWHRKVWMGGEVDCWIWCGARTLGGYGQMGLRGVVSRFLAHRIGYTWYRGEIPLGLVLMHVCDNPGCVNPWHLEGGSCLRNMWDKIGKGRQGGCVGVSGKCPF